MSSVRGEVTLLLTRIAAGDRLAEEALMQQVYLELHRIATSRLRTERAGHTLQPTALVHEAYLRLCGSAEIAYADRGHFFRLASRLMRRILVDHARQRDSQKRGEGQAHLPLDDVICVGGEQSVDALVIHDLIDRLELLSPRQASVVEMRYFGGLSDAEIAAAIGRDERTVGRDWSLARAWLRKQLRPS